MPQAVQTITFIVGAIVVIFGAYYATYWLARGSQKINQGRAIQVLDRFSLAKDKSIVVLSVYGKVYLVAFSSGAVTMLDSLDAEDVPQMNMDGPLSTRFGSKSPGGVVSSLIKKLPWMKNSANEANIPFELYLQQEQDAENLEKPDNLDAAYDRMKNRRGKEAQYSAFSDTTYYEEDIRK